MNTYQTYLFDKNNKQYNTHIIEEDDGTFCIDVYSQKLHVGYVKAFIEETKSELVLGDIKIFEEPLEFKRKFLFFKTLKPSKQNFRNRGLGTAMMKLLIELAQTRGMKGISGFVGADDAAATPYLFDWYRKNGFVFDEELTHNQQTPVSIYCPL